MSSSPLLCHQVFYLSLFLLGPLAICTAQETGLDAATPVTTIPEDGQEDAGRKLLAGVRDNVFSFDDPAFYWFCKRVRTEGHASKYDIVSEDVPTAWKLLSERPSDYRGELVTIEGRLEAKYSYTVPNRSGVGQLHQCELSSLTSRGICTVVVIDDLEKISPSAIVRAKGYFMKIRSYRTTGGEVASGPLIVAPRLQLVAAAPVPAQGWSSGLALKGSWVWVGAFVLLIAWILVRRGVQSSSRRYNIPSAKLEKSEESPQDFDWLVHTRDVKGEGSIVDAKGDK